MSIQVRVGKRGTIVIPKEIREKLGIEEGSILTITVEDNKIIIHTNDLWSELKKRAMKMKKIDVDALEREPDEAEEEWLRRTDT